MAIGAAVGAAGLRHRQEDLLPGRRRRLHPQPRRARHRGAGKGRHDDRADERQGLRRHQEHPGRAVRRPPRATPICTRPTTRKLGEALQLRASRMQSQRAGRRARCARRGRPRAGADACSKSTCCPSAAFKTAFAGPPDQGDRKVMRGSAMRQSCCCGLRRDRQRGACELLRDDAERARDPGHRAALGIRRGARVLRARRAVRAGARRASITPTGSGPTCWSNAPATARSGDHVHAGAGGGHPGRRRLDRRAARRRRHAAGSRRRRRRAARRCRWCPAPSAASMRWPRPASADSTP